MIYESETVLDTLPEGWVLAEPKDFYVEDKKKVRTFKTGMQFLLENNKGLYEVYNVREWWNNEHIYWYRTPPEPMIGEIPLSYNTIITWAKEIVLTGDGKLGDLNLFFWAKRCYVYNAEKWVKPVKVYSPAELKRRENKELLTKFVEF